MSKEEKEPKPKIKHRAGSNGFGGDASEQIADNKFAFYSELQRKLTGAPFLYQESIFDGEYMIFPMPRPPWKLATIPIEYTNPEQLYDIIRAYIVDHLYLPNEELYDVLTAWAFATWIPEAWVSVPYLFFFGVLSSGKTRGLEVLERICYRSILSANFSTAGLFRASELWHPTIFLDETEVYNQETRQDIISLLNCGYRKGQYVHRLRRTETGHELETFDVFGFKALAGTKSMRDTLESRSIIITMLPSPKPVRRQIDEVAALDIRNRLLGFRLEKLAKMDVSVNLVNAVNPISCIGVSPLDFGDGRLEELFDCLLRVAPKGHENIRAYALKTFEKKVRDRKSSMEAEVVGILVEEGFDEVEGFILTKTVKDKLIAEKGWDKKTRTQTVGSIFGRLGYEKEHRREGNGWKIEVDKVKYHMEYYETQLYVKQGSQGSQGSQDIDQMLQPQPLNESTPSSKDESVGAKKAAEKLKNLREMKTE